MAFEYIVFKILSLSTIILILCNGSQLNAILLESPRRTDWGVWGALEKCSPGSYVVGMQLKVEFDQGLTKDDTALNGVKFFCSNLNDFIGNTAQKNPITSTIGPWGFWRGMHFCSQDFDFEEDSSHLTSKVAVGFRLRSEGVRNHRDDTAANNLILICSDVNLETGEHGSYNRIEGDGTSWGDWTDEQICPTKYAICGLATQIEYSKGRRHDDTALNNIAVECCPIYVQAATSKVGNNVSPNLPSNSESVFTSVITTSEPAYYSPLDNYMEYEDEIRKYTIAVAPMNKIPEPVSETVINDLPGEKEQEIQGEGVNIRKIVTAEEQTSIPSIATVETEKSTEILRIDISTISPDINHTLSQQSGTKFDNYDGLLLLFGNQTGDKEKKNNHQRENSTPVPLPIPNDEINYEEENKDERMGTYDAIRGPSTSEEKVPMSKANTSDINTSKGSIGSNNKAYDYEESRSFNKGTTKTLDLIVAGYFACRYILPAFY